MEQIIIKNLWKSYDSLTVLKNVEIRRGRETSLSEPKQELELAFQTISPSSAFSNPIRMRNKVVFPVPEGLIRQ